MGRVDDSYYQKRHTVPLVLVIWGLIKLFMHYSNMYGGLDSHLMSVHSFAIVWCANGARIQYNYLLDSYNPYLSLRSGSILGLQTLLPVYHRIANLVPYLYVLISLLKSYLWYPMLLGGGELSAEETARLFFYNIVRFYGLPRQIIHDCDPRFASLFQKALFEILGNKLLYSSAYHPQTDGQTEQMNKVVEQILHTMATYIDAKWVNKLSFV